MLLALAALAADPLVTYQDAVRDATAAMTAALPRLAACPRVSDRVLLNVDFVNGASVTTMSVQGGDTTNVKAPCLEGVVHEVYARARPMVGREAAIVLDAGAGGWRLDGDVALFGHLPKDAVEAGIRSNINYIAACYTGQLEETPALRGAVVVNFTILPNGHVYAPTVARSTLSHPAAEACVLAQVGRVVFATPEAGAVVRVSYPFQFQPS